MSDPENSAKKPSVAMEDQQGLQSTILPPDGPSNVQAATVRKSGMHDREDAAADQQEPASKRVRLDLPNAEVSKESGRGKVKGMALLKPE